MKGVSEYPSDADMQSEVGRGKGGKRVLDYPVIIIYTLYIVCVYNIIILENIQIIYAGRMNE
jgi:hypothetical protein